MELTIDAMGDACPIPVVKTKKALGTMETGTVETHVDNETAVHNLENLAESLKCQVTHEQVAENEYVVKLTKTADSVSADSAEAGDGTRVVVISSQCMGTGDDELGAKLMKAFVFSLTQMDTLPDTILLYNGGAHLSCAGSPVLDDLKALADAGVEVLTCGTCLAHYGITDQLAVGDVTNMYVIVEKQLKAGVTVRP
ncbi:MAG: sulfurtransferase-like selenium metabolism protein YedF [Eggerthellaceae bacterium]|jgi:selenium metabolism protein YedF